jgi:hypothetical protein
VVTGPWPGCHPLMFPSATNFSILVCAIPQPACAAREWPATRASSTAHISQLTRANSQRDVASLLSANSIRDVLSVKRWSTLIKNVKWSAP